MAANYAIQPPLTECILKTVSNPMNLQHSEITSSASMENRTPQDHSSAQYFALIAIDRYGKIHRQVAPSIIYSRDVILNPHVTAEFLKAVANSTEGLRKPSPESACTQLIPHHSVSYDSYESCTPEEIKPEGHVAPATNGYHGNPTLWPGPGIARSPILKDELLHKQNPFLQVHRMRSQEAILFIKDSQFLRRYYEKVFQNLQQINCRVLAKVYVKLVEPHKQVKHPYNGRKNLAGEKQELSPEESKPPWWPPEVRHREPDHLLKAERIALLLHILCDLHFSHGITSQKLKNADQSVRSQIVPVERLGLLEELYRVRAEEEKVLGGFVDTSVSISRMNLPAADRIYSRQGQLNSRVSLGYKQHSARCKSSSRNRGVGNTPMHLPRHLAGYTKSQESMIYLSPAPATSPTLVETEYSTIKETCPSTAARNSMDLISSHHAASHPLLSTFR